MFSLRLLGPIQVEHDGTPIHGFESRKALALLCYAAVRATPLARTHLADLFWPDKDEARGRGNLSRVLHNLSTLLPQCLKSEHDAIQFQRMHAWLDTHAFEQIVNNGDPTALQEAAALYRDEFMTGLFLDDCPELEVWLTEERERWRQRIASVLECLSGYYARRGEYEKAVPFDARLLDIEPWREEAHREMMLLLVLTDQRSQALAQYETCRRILAEEFGVEPSAETTALYEQVRDGQVIRPPLRAQAALHNLPAPGAPPFKGLEYFDVTDADWFFGRDSVTARLVERVRGFASRVNGERKSPSLIALVGASGSGKSSIVRAGVIAAFRGGKPTADSTSEDGSRWDVCVLTPTAHPLAALATTLTREAESNSATAQLRDEFAQDSRNLSLHLQRTFSSKPSSPNEEGSPHTPVLLVIDQFEELFTLCRDELEREQFIDSLLTAVAPEAGVRVALLLALRADFYAHLAEHEALRDAVGQQQVYIGPMKADELRHAIEEPARQGGWEFEPGLVDLMLRDVGDEPGALPLLSHALLETWKRRSGYTLTLKGYADSGGVRGAIARTAEKTHQELTPEQQAIARHIFLRLTELGEGTEDTRRRAEVSELIPHPEEADQVRAVLTKLADARLITTGPGTVEVAHEALIREWPTLREWLSQDREALRLHRHLTEAVQQWESLERESDALYRGTRLAQANEFAQAHPDALNDAERAFLAASNDQEQKEAREKEDQRQRELASARRIAEAAQKLGEEQRQRAEEQSRAATRLRRRAYFLASALVLAVVLAGIALFLGEQAIQNGVIAVQNAQAASHAQATAVADADAAQKAEARAIAQQRIATARELAASALSNLDVDPERSVLLAMQAVTITYSIDNTVTREAEEALHLAVQSLRLRLTLFPKVGVSLGLAFSPDGKSLATGGRNGQIQVWELPSSKVSFTLSGHSKPVNGVAFSPDGARLGSASDDGTAKVWDVRTHQPLLDLRAHKDAVTHIAFSMDRKRLVTSSADKTAKVWDAATGQELLTLMGHTDVVRWAEFSPDGTRIATASDDATARVWDTVSGKELLRLADFSQYVSSITFSPNGKQLATSGGDAPKIWDAASGKALFTLTGIKAGGISGIVFTPDGKYVATGATDGTAVVWDATTGQEFLKLPTGSPIDGNVVISPGCVAPPDAPFPWCGVYLATATRDQAVKLWDISPTGSQELLTVPGYWHFVNRDGTRLVTTTYSGTTNLTVKEHAWQLPNAPPLSDLETNSVERELSSSSVAAANDQVCIAFTLTPDQTRSATVSCDLIARIRDTASDRELLRFNLTGFIRPLRGSQTLDFSPDTTRLATASLDGTAKVWDLEHGGKELFTLTGHQDAILSIRFSPDGKHLATGGADKSLRVWDAATGKELLRLTDYQDWVDTVAFSPDGKRLASGSSDTTAKVWDVSSGKRLLNLKGHAAGVLGIAFSPDGTRIATGSPDGKVMIWDANTGAPLLTLSVPSSVWQLSFTPDGTRLVISSVADQTTRVYLLGVEDLMALARARVSRSLTIQECQEFLYADQCPP